METLIPVAKKIAIMLALYGAFFIAERVRPAQKPSLDGFLVDCRAGVFFMLVSPLAAFVPLAITATILSAFGAPLWRMDLSAIPILSVIASFFFFDFFYYWFHRLQHTSFLWEEHKLHHSDAHLCAATNYRHHWLEDLLRAFLLVLPMGLIFKFSVAETTLIGFAIGQWAYFIHANFRMSFGRFSWLVVGPQVHRIHHSIDVRHADKNFGAFFPIWDVIFGTYHHPAADEFPSTGVAGEQSKLTWRHLLLGPFPAWWKRLTQRGVVQTH